MTITTTTSTTWLPDLLDWRRGRIAEATAEHGLAALVGTTWLTARPVVVPGLPGVWSARDGAAHGEDGAQAYALTAGQSERFGERLARVIAPRSRLAVRVFDPAAPSRTSLVDIDSFPADERWQVSAHFRSAPAGSTRLISHVDGARTDDAVAGSFAVTVEGHQATLLALSAPGGQVQITFADQAPGISGAGFRFLTLPRPDVDGPVPLDFNRAHLPPCAFSDHYLCPIPPPQNRLPVAVTSGEQSLVRTAPR